MKILIIRLSSIGDIVLTFPMVSLIRKKYPDSTIDFLFKKEYESLFELIDPVNMLITFDSGKGFQELITIRKQISKNKYDIIIDLHNNIRSIFIRSFQKAQKYVFNKHSLKKLLLVKFKINLLKNSESITLRYIKTFKDLFSSINVTSNFSNGFGLKIPENISSQLQSKYDFLNNKNNDHKIIGLCPSAKHFTKMYPAEKLIRIGKDLSDKFKCSILLFGDSGDFEKNETIRIATGDKCINFAGKLSLLETTAALNLCDLVITNDTGPMHISNLLGKALIAIFGSTVKEFGFFPQGKNRYIFEVNGLSCRPCSHIGRESCPKGHFKCMKDIPVERIISTAYRILMQ